MGNYRNRTRKKARIPPNKSTKKIQDGGRSYKDPGPSNIGAFCLRMRENRSVRLQMVDLSEVMSFVMVFMKNMD